MPDGTVWERSPHTAVKHELLRGYLGGWYGKLAWTGRLLFIDGFAGPGRYAGGEEGSPLIALRMAIDHQAFQGSSSTAGCQRTLVFVEQDAARFQHLVRELSAFVLPPNVKVEPIHDDFESTLNAILNSAEGRLVPAFVMIDPFGWTGFPYSVVERIGQEPRSEVFVSFMIESINRWIGHRGQAANWDRLFGEESWRQMPELGTADERREFLVSLYQRRLRDAGFAYQWAFELRDSGNRPEYLLMFGSHSIEGLELMKETMWKVAPDGSFRYSDYTQGAGQMRLFLGDPDPAVLAGALRDRFGAAGEVYRPGPLREFTVVETPFVRKHLTASLRYLERERSARIRRPEGRNRNYFDKVWVTFD